MPAAVVPSTQAYLALTVVQSALLATWGGLVIDDQWVSVTTWEHAPCPLNATGFNCCPATCQQWQQCPAAIAAPNANLTRPLGEPLCELDDEHRRFFGTRRTPPPPHRRVRLSYD